MYVAMNRFQVNPDREQQFEEVWKQRETFLEDVPGFLQFMLLRGEEEGEYISHSTWAEKDAFLAWTRSEAFVKGHAQANLEGVLAGPPSLGLFEPVIVETATSRDVSDSQPVAGRKGPRH